MQRPINVWNTHFRRLFLSVSNYIHIWIIFYNCYCGWAWLLFPASTTMSSYNRNAIRARAFTTHLLFFFSKLVQNLPSIWPEHGYFSTKHTFELKILQYSNATVAPNNVQVDIGHQHSCVFVVIIVGASSFSDMCWKWREN